VWSAYWTFPLVLGYLLVRRRDTPFRTLFMLFGAFVLLCGTTHLMEAVIFWWPAYRLAGVLKLLTAVVSWATIVALVRATPTVLAVRSPAELEREIDARKQAEEQVRESERRLRLAMEAAGTGLWEWDVATNAVAWSPECYPIHGLREGEFDGTGVGFDGVVHPDDRVRVWATVRGAMEKRARYECEFRIVRHDGVRWVANLGSVVYDDLGRPVKMIGTITDITTRKEAECQLVEARRFLRSSIDALSSHIAVLDENGVIITVNEAWRRFADANQYGGPNYGVGANYLNVNTEECGEGRMASEGLAAVLAGCRSYFELEYPCHSPTE